MGEAHFSSVLTNRFSVADGTMAFEFEKPHDFHFFAGQHTDVTLIDPSETDDEGNMRTFSLASAPSDEHLMIATRMRDSAFKRVLASMPLGTPVSLRPAYGVMTLHNDISRSAIFLTGGIGITPFLSMIRDATLRQLPHHLFLFYSNRQRKDAAFFQKLEEYQSQHKLFSFIPTLTEADALPGDWKGETGYITHDMITKHVSDDARAQALFYIAGPEIFVKAMRDMLLSHGIGIDHIRFENFLGYEKKPHA